MSAESAHVPGPLRAAHRSAALRRLRRARPPARLGARARQLRAVRPPGLSGLPPGCSALLRGVAEGVPGAGLEKEGKEKCRLPVLLPFLPFFFFISSSMTNKDRYYDKRDLQIVTGGFLT